MTGMTDDKITREEANAAYDALDGIIHPRIQDELGTLGRYIRQLEDLNAKLADHAARAGKVLEVGRNDLLRHGWDKCAETASADPFTQATLKAAYPYDTEEKLP